MDKMEMAAIEALIGMQNDCEAMQKLTQKERDNLLKSVTEKMREIRNEALKPFELVYEASEDGQALMSCCDGAHFHKYLMAGDRVYRVSYVHTARSCGKGG